MNVEEILEMMDEMLDRAVAMPLSGGKSLIDVNKMRELVSEVRLNIPSEIKQARNLVTDRKAIIEDAKAEADSIVRKAEEKAKELVAKEEILRQATAKAAEIVSASQSKSKEIRYATNEFVNGVLGGMEELLARNLTDVKKARGAMKTTDKKQA